SDQGDSGDFVHQWGNWQVDYDRFPNGLGYLTDRAHELGMRFGVWVEPERIDRTTLGMPGAAEERFLATSKGLYNPDNPFSKAPDPNENKHRAQARNRTLVPPPPPGTGHALSAQICLVDHDAHTWLLGKLVNFLEDVHPDYLKWDNNFWVNCDRAGHGH